MSQRPHRAQTLFNFFLLCVTSLPSSCPAASEMLCSVIKIVSEILKACWQRLNLVSALVTKNFRHEVEWNHPDMSHWTLMIRTFLPSLHGSNSTRIPSCTELEHYYRLNFVECSRLSAHVSKQKR